jgi:hypothetical protein
VQGLEKGKRNELLLLIEEALEQSQIHVEFLVFSDILSDMNLCR